MNNKKLPLWSILRQRPHILPIDDVDVFLHEDFYGNFYHPFVKISENKYEKYEKLLSIIRSTTCNTLPTTISTDIKYIEDIKKDHVVVLKYQNKLARIIST